MNPGETNYYLGMFYVTAIVFLVGITLFLLPPVAGVPIYFTAGIILTAAGTSYEESPSGSNVWAAIAYTFVFCIAIKLVACAIQQNGFGMCLRNSVAVKQFIGINTHGMRTARLILKRPGMNIAKVAILIGAPDWPISVLCGILNLPLLPILFSTLPVGFLTAPIMLAGSFLYLGTMDGWEWASTMTTILLLLGGGVQFCSMLAFMYFLDQEVVTSAELLKEMPYDEDVRQADEQVSRRQKRYAELATWKTIGCGSRLVLGVAMFLMTASCYLVQLGSTYCFTPFPDVTSTVAEDLDGSVLNLFKALGWIAVAMFVLACILLDLFNRYMASVVSADMKAAEDQF
uniref:Uncharacterized protein n=1 Tax=Octactis speculum TaxID=3111310 RepID=A0A7S2H4K2_9STRA